MGFRGPRPADFQTTLAAPADNAPIDHRGQGTIGAVTMAIALVGATLLATGAAQVLHRDDTIGLPVAAPGVVAQHQAKGPADLAAAHADTGPATPVVATPKHGDTTKASAAGPVPSSEHPSTSPAHPAQGTQLPNTIRLPLGGSAYLVHGQVDANGSLPVPSALNQAVWWGTGPTASAGATVFAGHVNWAGSIGPFAELWKDGPGAIVTIRDNAGAEHHYQVTQALVINKNDLPKQADTLFAPTGPPRLVLATCGGEWIGGTTGYDDNRVLIATPMAS